MSDTANLTPEQQADLARYADRFESDEFDVESKPIYEASPETQLAHARYVRAQLDKERKAVDEQVQAAVDAAREAHWSWRKIGNALGVSDQAVRSKFGHPAA
jgi:uncharacterized membrane protein YcjF (UPF0283 family)